MGCFDATCVFTRTAICAGEPTLLVGVQPVKDKNNLDTSDLNYAIGKFEREFYTKNSNRNTKIDKESWSNSPLRFVFIGEYDGYGSISNLDKARWLDSCPEWWGNWQFLTHKRVAEEILGFSLDGADLYASASQLVHIAFQARIQLFVRHTIGSQFSTVEEIELQQKILNLSQDFLQTRQKLRTNK